MFRKMRRFNQQITDEECIEVLKNTKRGVLSLIGDDGYPDGIAALRRMVRLLLRKDRFIRST